MSRRISALLDIYKWRSQKDQAVQLAATLRLILISNIFFKEGEKSILHWDSYEHLCWQSFFQAVFENRMFPTFLLLTSPGAGASLAGSVKLTHQQIYRHAKCYFLSHLSEYSMILIIISYYLLMECHRMCKDQWTVESLIQIPCFLGLGYVRPRVLCLAQGPIELQSAFHLTYLIQPKRWHQCLDTLSFADRCLHQLLSLCKCPHLRMAMARLCETWECGAAQTALEQCLLPDCSEHSWGNVFFDSPMARAHSHQQNLDRLPGTCGCSV